MSSIERNCCVPTCNSQKSECWFYDFPEDEVLYETWLKQCGLPSDANSAIRDYSLVICSAHFDSKDFLSDGELFPYAIPSLNLPAIVMEELSSKSVETLIDPSHLFVSLFIDEAGKIVNFSLVEFRSVEQWQQDENFEYGVAEIFTNADKSMDKKLGLLGTLFSCSKCKTMQEFGVVVMQKREVFPDTGEVPEVDNDEVEEELENMEEHELIHVAGRMPMIEEVPTDELEERLVEYSSSNIKRNPPPLTMPPQSLLKKARMTFADVNTVENKDETILGIKFFNHRSCNKCGFAPDNEDLLQHHVETCRLSQLETSKTSYVRKFNTKGGQRIRSNYICSKCTLSILHRDLQAHAEFHVKFAPYACKCSKCFATKDELAEHSQICGQHLFTCKICYKEFVKKRDMYQHKAEVHGLGIQGQVIVRSN